ncbi:MAG TPA: hypothetical protein PKA16_13130 [Ottowia sp.]|uniref:hypothetical protein n=1 Tax=Ottowia sp. TaxID=1898956 RepID=UPI002C1EC917|nr:hypothetical protein [Ottowia sp.]HMN22320.1 hypothetical protein [Ottowia sp.]
MAPNGSALVASSQQEGLSTLDAIHVNKMAADGSWSGQEQVIRDSGGVQVSAALAALRTTDRFALTWLRGRDPVEAVDCH